MEFQVSYLQIMKAIEAPFSMGQPMADIFINNYLLPNSFSIHS